VFEVGPRRLLGHRRRRAGQQKDVSRCFPVTLAYPVDAALNMALKLSVEFEGPADLLLVDIGITREKAQVCDESCLRESVNE